MDSVSADEGASYTVVSAGSAPWGNTSDLPSVFSNDGTSISMYGRGMDGGLYNWYFNGNWWTGPISLGGIINGPPSAICGSGSPGSRPEFAFALGTDGGLYVWASDGWHWVAMPPNVWAISPPQVFMRTSDNTCADIYFTGSDGNVHFEPCWNGVWQTLPGSGGVNGFGLLSAVNRAGDPNRVDVFVKAPVGLGGSATLWAEYQSGSLVNHNLLSALPNSIGKMAAVNFDNTSKVWLFFTGADHQMYGGTSDSTGTSYTASAQLSGTPLVTSPITTFAPDNNTILAFARRQSDGHLIQVRWVGSSMQPVQDLGVAIM